MKKILLPLMLLIGITGYSQGVKFSEGSFEEAKKEAAAAKKMIFTDFYTDWCAPCKKMSQTIFPLAGVGSYFNANFITFKVNAEKGEGIALAKKYGVSEYPTFIFFTPEGEVIYRFMGTRDSSAVIKEGEKALGLFRQEPAIKDMRAKYEGGNRDKDFLKEYCSVLIESGRETGAPLNDYLIQLTSAELMDEGAAKFIGAMTLYSPPLSEKIIKLLGSLYDINPKLPEFMQINKAYMKSLSSFLKNSGKQNSTEELEVLLKVKDKMAAMGNKDNIVSASMGGGLAMIPNDEIRLMFYQSHKMDMEYATLFGEYVDKYIAANPEDKIIKENEAFNTMFTEGLEKLRTEGKSEKEIASAKQMSGLVKVMREATSRHYAGLIINNCSRFLNIYNDDASKKRAAEWIWYAYATCKAEDVAREASSRLREIGDESMAKKVEQDFAEQNPAPK